MQFVSPLLMHKLREAMMHETAEARLAGEVEIDGAYFGGHVRPTNARKDRVDRRLWRTAAVIDALSLPYASAAVEH
jgi:hypothetical protein